MRHFSYALPILENTYVVFLDEEASLETISSACGFPVEAWFNLDGDLTNVGFNIAGRASESREVKVSLIEFV